MSASIVSRLVAVCGLALLAVSDLSAEDNSPSWLKPDPAAVQRWQDMRFGMFIHWGPVSLTGCEISHTRGAPTPIEVYDNLYKRFDAKKFNADAWVATAKATGMKYVVFVAKHHDGFCLWDTKQTDYNIMQSPFGRDAVKELAAACKRGGVAFGTYYSVCDWYHPDFPLSGYKGKVKREKSDLDAYNRFLLAQTKELITSYGPLLTIWNDVPQVFEGRGKETIKLARSLQPDILVNNRTGDGGDYDTPEGIVGGFNMKRPWETCMTLCNWWSWRPHDRLKTLPKCLRALVNSAGGDGNFLLNVGPMPTGEIEPRQVERLKEIGAWMAKHGESIYGTRGGPFKPARQVVSTRKGNTIYLHILAWSEEALTLPALPAKIVGSSLLTGGKVDVTQTDTGVKVAVPKSDRQEIDTIVSLQLDKPALDIAPITVVSVGGSLTTFKPATASNFLQNSKYYRAAKALDGADDTRWATDRDATQCWLEVDLGKPETFDRAFLDECQDFAGRVKSFELQGKEGDRWKTFYKGAAIGYDCEVTFSPVTARYVRLTIEGERGPSINEFQLFAPVADKPSESITKDAR